MVKFFTKIIFTTVFGFLPLIIFSATLSFSQPDPAYKVGQVFSTSIFVGSSDQAMNAVSSSISFPKDILEVIAVSKAGSILSLWAQEPSFSNISGRIGFEGIVPNPGFIGSAGKIISVTFRAKAEGVAKLSFLSASVLANDGLGTNILTDHSVISFKIDSSLPIILEDKPLVIDCSSLPDLEINSSTNKPDTWVSDHDSKLSWILPGKAIAVQTSLSAKSDSVPSVNYDPPISKKNLTNTPDGVWYFNLRYKVGDCWSQISRYKLKIDTAAPNDLLVKSIPVNDDKIALEFSAKDALSGIAYYEINVGDGTIIIVNTKDLVDGQYPLENISAGKYNLKVKAFDFAGNSSDAVYLIVNIPVSNLPKINKIDDVVVFKNFEIKGWLGNNSIEAKLYIQRGSEEPLIVNINDQNVGLETNHLSALNPTPNETDGILVSDFIWSGSLKNSGKYQAWLETVDITGVKRVSEKAKFNVLPVSSFSLIDFLTKYLNKEILGTISLFAIIILIIIILLRYLVDRFGKLKNCDRKLKSKIDIGNIKTFTLMENNVKEYISSLEKAKKKRKLSSEEMTILSGLKKEEIALDKFFFAQRHLVDEE